MRILQISTKVPYPPKDGGAAGVFAFSKALAGLGHEIVILAVNPPKHFVSSQVLSDVAGGIKIVPVDFDTKPVWFKALRNLFFSRIPYQIERFIHKKFQEQLVDLLLQFKPDKIQIEGVYLCPYIPLIRKYTGEAVILRAHNIEHILWENIACNTSNRLKRYYLEIQASRMKKFELAQLLRVDAVTTVTEQDKRIIKSYFPHVKCEVFPFGLPPLAGKPQKKTDCHSLAFIGALDWIPNQEAIHWFVKSVWPALMSKFSSLQLHIAGRNAPPWLISFFQKQRNVTFHGEVADAADFFNKFCIMVVPLFSGSGIRVKIIEAMQQGLVIIASTKAAEGIPAVPGEHILIANTPDEFVIAMEYLWERNDRMEKIASNAFLLIDQNFNIINVSNRLVAFFDVIHHG